MPIEASLIMEHWHTVTNMIYSPQLIFKLFSNLFLMGAPKAFFFALRYGGTNKMLIYILIPEFICLQYHASYCDLTVT